MKKFINIFFLLTIILAAGCQDVGVIDPQLSYKEYIVVRAKLTAGQDFEGVLFTKTLPVNEKYDISKAELKNVTAYLKIGGVQIVPLHYTANGVYMPVDRIHIYSDYTYELFAKVNNNSIYSITRVPEKPNVTSAAFYNNTYLTANIISRQNEVYGATWDIYAANRVIDEALDFQEVVQQPGQFSTSLPVRTLDLPEAYKSTSYNNMRYVRVYAFDSPYLKFFKTRNNNQPVSDVFSQGGDQVIWNVQGQNTIGLFIGVALGDYIKAQ